MRHLERRADDLALLAVQRRVGHVVLARLGSERFALPLGQLELLTCLRELRVDRPHRVVVLLRAHPPQGHLLGLLAVHELPAPLEGHPQKGPAPPPPCTLLPLRGQQLLLLLT